MLDTKELISSKEIQSYVPINSKINSNIFSMLLDDNKVVASYKMYWLLGILDEVGLGNVEIQFKIIIARMIVYAWYPHRQYMLNFGASDNLKKPINYISSNYGFLANCNEKELLEFIINNEDKELKKMLKELTYNVPYRLLSPFFNEIFSKNDSDTLRHKKIIEASLKSEICLYKIIKGKTDKIVINDCWREYLTENYRLIKSWIYYKLVCFLQKRNRNVPAIVFKLEAPKDRKLSEPTKLWKKIIASSSVTDIYTGKEFNETNYNNFGKLSIDHFIPWSFVLHDEMWNLVPTFKNINSAKSNILLPFDKYIDDFCNIQYKAFSYACDKKEKNIIEEYANILRVDNPYDYYKNCSKIIFSNNIKQCISPLYQIALNQGFQVVNKVFL